MIRLNRRCRPRDYGLRWLRPALLAIVVIGVLPAAASSDDGMPLSEPIGAAPATTVAPSEAAAVPGQTPVQPPTIVDASTASETAAHAPPSGGSSSNELEEEPSNPITPTEKSVDRAAQQTVHEQRSSAAQSELEAMPWPESIGQWVDTDRLASSAQLGFTLMVLGFIPALFLMTTAYLRITIVLAVLRQAFGSQLLPMQATTALSLLCTGLVMWPTWTSVYEKAVVPASHGVNPSELIALWQEGAEPIREFMIRQIDARGSAEDVHLFLRQVATAEEYPTSYEEVPLHVLLPAFVISELKAAFLIGFQIYLPFLVIDLVVATLTTSMGMFMLPPGMVSLPLKLLLFVLVDGWRLIVEMLLSSFP